MVYSSLWLWYITVYLIQNKKKTIVNCFKNFCTKEFCFYDAAKLSNNIG